MLLRISEDATGDLDEVFNYWSQRATLQVAERILDKIGERFSLLTRYPRAGVLRMEFGPEIRCISAGDYVIYYRIAPQRIEIIRVLHGARNQRRAFRSTKKLP